MLCSLPQVGGRCFHMLSNPIIISHCRGFRCLIKGGTKGVLRIFCCNSGALTFLLLFLQLHQLLWSSVLPLVWRSPVLWRASRQQFQKLTGKTNSYHSIVLAQIWSEDEAAMRASVQLLINPMMGRLRMMTVRWSFLNWGKWHWSVHESLVIDTQHVCVTEPRVQAVCSLYIFIKRTTLNEKGNAVLLFNLFVPLCWKNTDDITPWNVLFLN